MTEQIELFTTVDESWLDYALMFIASVRKSTNADIRYTIFCPGHTNGAVPEAWGTSHGVQLQVVDFDARMRRSTSGRYVDLTLPIPGISECAYWGRYCASFVLDNAPRRLIYADVDMYATGDLLPLMKVDLGDAPVGAVRYPNDAAVGGTGVPHGRYVNNGLLVFDMHRFDGQKCIADMQRALASGRTVFGPQCAFNMAMNGNIQLLDNIWNVQGEWRDQLTATAKVIHFTGNTKPWHTLSTDPLRWTVRDLLRDVGCPKAWRPDRSATKILRLATRRARTAWKRS